MTDVRLAASAKVKTLLTNRLWFLGYKAGSGSGGK
jgi:hypothetical protein